jgi:hypothetical protein
MQLVQVNTVNPTNRPMPNDMARTLDLVFQAMQPDKQDSDIDWSLQTECRKADEVCWTGIDGRDPYLTYSTSL